MFGSVGMPELIVILVIALIFFGPGKLPELGSMIGKAIRVLKKRDGCAGGKTGYAGTW